ncbi:MAG: metal ABC transporter permease [Chlamydiota bacterium]
MNLYTGVHGLSFLRLFFYRLYEWLMGGIALKELAIDERQIVCLVLLSISCSLLGSFLLLRRSLMVATALSHTALLGVVTVFVVLQYFGWRGAFLHQSMALLFFSAIIASVLTLLVEDFFSRFLRLQKDVSIALAFNMLFALGVIFVSLYTKNVHLGMEMIQGNIDGVTLFDVRALGLLAFLNVGLITLFYPTLQITSFDPILAKSLRASLFLCRWLLCFLTAATIIGAFRSVGIVLVLAFLTVPYLTAFACVKQLRAILWMAPCFGASASLVGTALSRHLLSVYSLTLSTGAIVVLTLFFQYGLVLLLQSEKNKPKEAAS